MEKNFTEQDSLRLINEMIVQARSNIQQGSANAIIFAGYCVAFTAILNFVLLQVLTPAYNSFWVWLLMIPMSVGCSIISKKVDRNALVKTHVDKTISVIWSVFFISIVLYLTVVFGFAVSFHMWMLTVLITPVIMIMVGAAQYVTAVTSRFMPFRTGAFLFWGGALLCLISRLLIQVDLQFIILAVCMIFGFVVPGYVLNRKAKENV